jgi:hypothetical protein
MEKRTNKRFSPATYYHINFLRTDRVKIKDLSVNGICLETSRYVNRNDTYSMIIITEKDNKIILKGKVVWSYLRKSMKNNGDIYPIYDIGIKFIQQNGIVNNIFNKLTKNFANKKTLEKENLENYTYV